MAKLAGINHLRAIRALKKAGFHVAREGKHTILTDGTRILVVPRANPIKPHTMGAIITDAGLTVEQFKDLL